MRVFRFYRNAAGFSNDSKYVTSCTLIRLCSGHLSRVSAFLFGNNRINCIWQRVAQN
jgi:hypothetical protein